MYIYINVRNEHYIYIYINALPKCKFFIISYSSMTYKNKN
nr:MAG TPA: hypothetical protein [Caudoviricetes sp.]